MNTTTSENGKAITDAALNTVEGPLGEVIPFSSHPFDSETVAIRA